MNNAKFYVPLVTLSINDNMKFLENIKQGFKRTISWNKCRSEITTQPKNNDLDYLIGPRFRNINRLFALSSKNGNNDPTINSFDKNYVPLVEVKDFNVLIDNEPFFDQPVKNNQEEYEKVVEMSRNYNYTTGNVLDYLYHQKYFKFNMTSKYKYSPTNKFCRKIRRRWWCNNVFYCWKAAIDYSKFCCRFISCNRII